MPERLAGGKLLLDEPAEAVARLTLNRPDSRNALDHETLKGIAEAMPGLDRGIEIRCVILTGAGGIFSAGYDIGGFSEDEFETEAESLVAHPFARGLDAVAAHPWPVVCAINGHALGGALELTLCCDLRICARGAKLGMPPAKLGLIYGHTGLQRFIDAIGVPRTKELFLTGDNVTAERAEEIGLVNLLADGDALEAAAVELAAGIAANAPLSMKGNKHAIDTLNSYLRLTPEQKRELIELRESCFRSEDFREGVAAFAEKRAPRWKGR
ncbi:MAG TPA: enoyl-CoA hydratase/isomerase family protein [Solirubrobacterales bacterium]|nr:enoyl-CoA hydratase/isomerase family protein [Solirubrobacterales bacterium]